MINAPRILGIDPGPMTSGFVVWEDSVIEAGEIEKALLLSRIIGSDFGGASVCGIEAVESFGMAVGKDVFETVFWVGRIYERAHRLMDTRRVYRKAIKLHPCQSPRAKDPNIRQALIDKYGHPGTKKNPGRLRGVSGHAWSALAVADYTLSLLAQEA